MRTDKLKPLRGIGRAKATQKRDHCDQMRRSAVVLIIALPLVQTSPIVPILKSHSPLPDPLIVELRWGSILLSNSFSPLPIR